MSKEIEKTSYALGMDIGASFHRLPVTIDLESAIQGMTDVFRGEKPQITQTEFNGLMHAFQENLKEAAAKAAEQAGSANKKQEADFFAKNKTEAGVVTTASGLQYKVMTEGKGDQPKADSVVTVHYTGMLPDGSVFDSSVERGEPATFPLNQVIRGWTEGLQLMKVGGKFKFFIPSALGYGSRGAGGMIGPDQMLIFDVELLKIEK